MPASDELRGDKKLAASLMYGAGLRLTEVLHMRVHDIDFARSEITVRAIRSNSSYGANQDYSLLTLTSLSVVSWRRTMRG
jgi:hypothetical protein